MEANHQKQSPLQQQEQQSKTESKSNDGGRGNETMDPTTKLLIREAIVAGEKGGGSEADDAVDVLAFNRSVNKIDCSLE